MTSKPKPIFNKRIFWDVVFENIDYDAKANFVIERVFERGDVDGRWLSFFGHHHMSVKNEG
ncbi:MAG: DUF6922 domain-containing protein [Cyclobacteriaceae bacterium]